MKPVLVGMNNPYGADPYYALYPLPERSAGGRLYRMIVDADPSVTMIHYRGGFERVNLCTGPWRMPDARVAAHDLLTRWRHRVVVLLGRDVAEAFGVPRMPPDAMYQDGETDCLLFQLPHPSGRNQWYNDLANRRLAGELLARLHNEYRAEHIGGAAS